MFINMWCTLCWYYYALTHLCIGIHKMFTVNQNKPKTYISILQAVAVVLTHAWVLVISGTNKAKREFKMKMFKTVNK